MCNKQRLKSSELELGKLGIAYLKEIWTSTKLQKEGRSSEQSILKHNYVTAVFDALGVGLEPTYQYLFNESPSFEQFEDWILENGNVSKEMIQLCNSAILSQSNEVNINDNILDEEALSHWESEGYVIIPNAISKADCEISRNAIFEFLDIDPKDNSTWYNEHPGKKGIMVQLFHHPQLDQNRFSEKIKRAFAQLWKRSDLIVSIDRVSFNPPEKENYKFPGPNLHWDVSLKQPIPFGLQGLLYLSDTPANQGAFTLVPGFHRKIDDWLTNLPKDVNPRGVDLQQLGPKPIAAKAGDFIIWNQKLPHGSSPNLGDNPRIVQYINYLPIDREIESTWI